ncbi:hypothetical protein ACJEC8_00745 [Candidatus Carsonella ruddii]|uniref:phosphoribosylanthranilate isomerase n=1 Tax=Carsonella ruddii TaxID=114186 RepID=UPI003D9A71F8
MIKFCGVKNKNDINKAILSNSKFIGFNFYYKSIRYIGNDFLNLLKFIPKNIFKVALFVNNNYNEINKLKSFFDFFQFHGDESFIFCESFKKKYIKTIKIYDKKNFNMFYNSKYFYSFLIDKKNIFYGGNGKIYNHFKILRKKFFISGGIDINNYKKITLISSLLNLDICSSIEQNDIKNIKKMINFY